MTASSPATEQALVPRPRTRASVSLPDAIAPEPEVKEARHDDAVEEALCPLRDTQGERVLRPLRDLLPPVA